VWGDRGEGVHEREDHGEAVTEEVDVKSVLSKVELGEVDAGVVYVTDVRSAGSKVKGVTIPASVNASTHLSDRGPDACAQRGRRAGVRRLRAVPARGCGAHRGRVQGP